MNFKKFSKSVSPDGYIYTEGENTWLTDGNVFMLIPSNVGIGGIDNGELPDEIQKRVRAVYTLEAHLSEAILPDPDSKIKDCIRIYRADDEPIRVGISNDAWSIIEDKDRCFIAYEYADGVRKVLGLLVKDREETLLGAVLGLEDY